MQVCFRYTVLVWFLAIFFLLHRQKYSHLEAIYESVTETGANKYAVCGTTVLIRSPTISTWSHVSIQKSHLNPYIGTFDGVLSLGPALTIQELRWYLVYKLNSILKLILPIVYEIHSLSLWNKGPRSHCPSVTLIFQDARPHPTSSCSPEASISPRNLH